MTTAATSVSESDSNAAQELVLEKGVKKTDLQQTMVKCK